MSKTKKPTRKHVSSGSEWEVKFGYSRAVAQGDFCFVSGTTGTNYETGKMPEAPPNKPAMPSPQSTPPSKPPGLKWVMWCGCNTR